ncbi:hypothetical protein Ae201684P_010998 [Aphanomyces euteiches]|nr:hypothetical protein Ae201684P_010998 [Aphanomyces euteiches]
MTWDPDVRRCYKCLAEQFEADDVYSEFQALDADGNGVLKPKDFVRALSTLLGENKHVDVENVAQAFQGSKKRVNYTDFCYGMQDFEQERAKAKENDSSDGNKSHRSKDRPSTESTSVSDNPNTHNRPRKRHSKKKQDGASDAVNSTIRVDERLEKHRILKASIRHKVLHGVKKSTSSKEGFDSIRDLLVREDHGGDGMLDEHTCLVNNMKSPLTKQEMGYLTLNLRNKKHPKCINYEQIGHFLCVDSEEEASTSGDDATHPLASPVKKFELLDQPHLGSDVLSVERDLRAFMTQRVPKVLSPGQCSHAPRSIFTGAEKFLEACELIDPLDGGKLSEDGFENALQHCGLTVTTAQLRSVLSKFPRDSNGLINYAAFLERYGQHIATVKQHKHLKSILQRLATDPDRDAAVDLNHFRKQLEKVDSRVTGVPTGLVSKKDFVACLTSHASLKWPKQDVEACLPLFIEPGKDSRNRELRAVQYGEFLRMVDDLISPTASKSIIPCQCAVSLSSTSSLEKLHRRLHAFLHGDSRGAGARGRDIALHAFEAADKMRHGSIAKKLHERDFFTVLRTIGAAMSPAENRLLLHALSQSGCVSSDGIQYNGFLRQFEAPPLSPSKRETGGSDGMTDHGMCVGTYLADHATNDERRNFDMIMNIFKAFPLQHGHGDSANELIYALGPHLKVSLHFFT